MQAINVLKGHPWMSLVGILLFSFFVYQAVERHKHALSLMLVANATTGQ